MSLAIGMGIGIPFSPLSTEDFIDEAINWPFGYYADANNGELVGPWNDLTRTGLGTRIGPTGLVEYGPHNLLNGSRRFDTRWTALTSPTYIGDGAPILGRDTGKFSGSAASSGYYAYWTGGIVAGGVYTGVWLVRRTSASGAVILGFDGVSSQTAGFNFDTGTYTSGPANKSAVQIGDAWLLRITFTAPSTGAEAAILYASAAGVTLDAAVFVFSGTYSTTTELVQTDGAPVYLPRITHDPVTHAALGLLVEAQGTNRLGANDDLTNASVWLIGSNVLTPVSSGTYQGRARWTIQKAGSTTSQYLLGLTNISAAGDYVARMALFAGTATTIGVGLYDSATGFGSVTKISGPGTTSGADVIGLSPTEPTIVDLHITASATPTVYLLIYPGGAGSTNAADTVSVQVNNVEAGPVATSYIPNSGTGTAVRVADDWYLSGAGLTAALGADTSVGAVYVEFVMPSVVGFPGVVSIETPTERLALWVNQGQLVAIGGYGGAAANAEISPVLTAIPAGSIVKAAFRWTTSGYAGSVNGSPPTVSSNARNLAGATVLRLGKTIISAPYLNSSIRSVRVIDPNISNEALQALTA